MLPLTFANAVSTVSEHRDGSPRHWRVARSRGSRHVPDASVEEGLITPDGTTILVDLFARAPVYGAWDLHDLERGVVIPSTALFPVGPSYGWPLYGLNSPALSDDGQLLAYTTPQSQLVIFDRRIGLIESVPAVEGGTQLAFGPGGKRLLFNSTWQILGDPNYATNGVGSVYLLDRDPDNDGIPSYWEQTFGLDPNNAADAATDADGDGSTALQEFQVASNPIATTTRYFAEGAANGFFSSRVAVLNPGASANTVTLRMLGAGGQTTSQTKVIPANARATFQLANGPDTAFAIVAEGSKPFVAERAMYYSTPGQPMAAGHAGAGIAAPALRWFLAEGATGFFDEFVLIANPGDAAAVDGEVSPRGRDDRVGADRGGETEPLHCMRPSR